MVPPQFEIHLLTADIRPSEQQEPSLHKGGYFRGEILNGNRTSDAVKRLTGPTPLQAPSGAFFSSAKRSFASRRPLKIAHRISEFCGFAQFRLTIFVSRQNEIFLTIVSLHFALCPDVCKIPALGYYDLQREKINIIVIEYAARPVTIVTDYSE